MSKVPCHVSYVICHKSCVMCHISCVTFQIFFFSFLYKVVKLIGGGSVVIRTYLPHLVFKRSRFSKHRPSGPMLSISQNVRLSVCLYVCLFVRLFTFEVPFKRLFAPTSRGRMSNIFRDSESLGKSNEKSGLRFEHSCLKVV